MTDTTTDPGANAPGTNENTPDNEKSAQGFDLRLGIIHRDELDGDEYHRAPGISKSGLALIADKTPLHYITQRMNPRPATPALFFGKAYHHLILEPETFDQFYAPEPIDAPRRPTELQIRPRKGEPKPEHADAAAFWADWDTQNAGKEIISTRSDPSIGIWGRSDWDDLRYMRDTLLDPFKHSNICLLLAPHLIGEARADEPANLDNLRTRSSGGPTEVSAFVVDKYPPFSGGIQYEPTFKLMKCRLDKWNTDHNIGVDLKTAISAGYSDFARSVSEFSYHVQHAMYTDIMRQAGQPLNGFVFIAQEKKPPYAPAVYELAREPVDMGVTIYRQYLEIYAKCHNENNWPGYPQDIRRLDLPGWANRQKIS